MVLSQKRSKSFAMPSGKDHMRFRARDCSTRKALFVAAVLVASKRQKDQSSQAKSAKPAVEAAVARCAVRTCLEGV